MWKEGPSLFLFVFTSLVSTSKMHYSYIMSKKYFISSIFIGLAISIFFYGGHTSADSSILKNPTIPSSLKLKWDGGGEIVEENTIRRWINQENNLLRENGYSSEIENVQTCPNGNALLCDFLLTTRGHFQLRIVSQYEINEASITSFLEDISDKIDTDSTDAKFAVENGRVTIFSPEKTGIKLSIDSSAKKIAGALGSSSSESKEIELDTEVSNPSVAASEINNLGIATLIGQGKSNFRGSTKSRIHNIRTAIARFNGVLIKPGEEFSFVQTLGEVDGEHGYLPELVIKKDKTEPEFGGGICQVSTTTFRAAIYSGLKITARKNHAYPVSYYNPQGMDSTIYVPKPDLKFVNNTPGYILIQNRIEGTELIFDFYGTNDGRKIEVDGPKIIQRNPDGSMKTTFTQKVTDDQGNVLIEDVFNSAYDSPSKYPHPVDPSKITEKPKDWSQKQWDYFKKTGLLPTS